MSNALYDKGREKFLNADIDWTADDIIVLLVTSGYTRNLSTHEFITDLGANIVDRSGNLAGKSSTAGVADASNETLTAVTGSAVSQLVLAKNTGSDATSPLIANIDTATNLPVTPNGGDITIAWDNGANKIFKL
jgi:hypothetical protein